MKIENLNINRRQSYEENAGQLAGIVQMQGLHGKMEVKLSSQVVADILTLIKTDVQKTANYNAAQATEAVEEAVGEMALLEHNDIEVIDEKIPF